MKREKLKKQIYRGSVELAVILAVVVIALVAVPRLERWLFSRKTNTTPQAVNTSENSEVFIAGEWYRKKADLSTVLVIGVDNREGLKDSDSYNNEGQADFLMLLANDQKTGEGFALHINRDTITSIPVLAVNGRKVGRTNAQIALAYNYGNGRQTSCENVVDAIQYMLYGIGIDHYVALSMDGVALLNDGVGGVEVEIKDDFSDADPSLVMGETVRLEGEHALNFVRSRGNMKDKSNLNRMERQRQYVDAWIRQAQTLSESEAAQLELSVQSEIITDFGQTELLNLADTILESKMGEIYTLPGEAELGEEFMEYHLDEPGSQALVLDLFYDNVTDEHQ